MLTTLNDFILRFMDVLLGWMLHLPQDVALVIVAVGTSAILTFVRPLVTHQDLLRRCKQDKKRLKQLIREAKRRKDKDAVKRHRTTVGGIGIKTMKAEGKPLLLAIVPIACLAVWAFARLAFVPPVPGEPVTVNAYFRPTSIDKVAQIVPVDGIAPTDDDHGTWVRRIVTDPRVAPGGQVNGIATWRLVPGKREQPYTLLLRHVGTTVEKSLLVDGLRYAPVLEFPEDGPVEAVETALVPFRPFGFIPGIPWLWLDPWLVGYLVVCIPFVFVLRRFCHVY
ncbi:MAG TPA: hypothetical protein VMY39_11025 [Planctomycetota bacterium]|nr:hypothetical protein [Planctomycetota bacterium]